MDTTRSESSIERISADIFQIIPMLKRRLPRLNTFQGDHSLPQSYFQVLSLLDERGSMSISEISDYFDIAKPNITPLVDRLVEGGLVDRVRSTNDRRVVYIVILDKGRERLNELRSQMCGSIALWQDRLSSRDFDKLAKALGDVLTVLAKL